MQVYLCDLYLHCSCCQLLGTCLPTTNWCKQRPLVSFSLILIEFNSQFDVTVIPFYLFCMFVFILKFIMFLRPWGACKRNGDNLRISSSSGIFCVCTRVNPIYTSVCVPSFCSNKSICFYFACTLPIHEPKERFWLVQQPHINMLFKHLEIISLLPEEKSYLHVCTIHIIYASRERERERVLSWSTNFFSEFQSKCQCCEGHWLVKFDTL